MTTDLTYDWEHSGGKVTVSGMVGHDHLKLIAVG